MSRREKKGREEMLIRRKGSNEMTKVTLCGIHVLKINEMVTIRPPVKQNADVWTDITTFKP